MGNKLSEPIKVGNLTFKTESCFHRLQQDMKKETDLLGREV